MGGRTTRRRQAQFWFIPGLLLASLAPLSSMRLFVSKLVRLCLAGGSLGIGILLAADEASQPSPFLPASGSAAQTAPDPSAGYEFVGVTATQTQTLVSIRRLSDQRSVWIPVGQTVAEITVVAYNPTRDEVTLRTPNASLTLRLHDHAPATASARDNPRSLPEPAAAMSTLAPIAVPTKPLSAQAEKELEARMLVTDLLEIGQQQRKAYEEARREAATKAAPPPPVSTSVPAPRAKPVDSAPAPQPASAPATPTK